MIASAVPRIAMMLMNRFCISICHACLMYILYITVIFKGYCTLRPSKKRTIRLVCFARCSSCVTMTIVVPSRVEAAEKIHDFAAHFTVEVSGRLVGQQNPGCAHQSPCDGYALALSAGELRRIVFHPGGRGRLFRVRTLPVRVALFPSISGTARVIPRCRAH